MPHSLDFLLRDPDAKEGRLARRKGYQESRDPADRSLLMDLRYVVHVEHYDGQFTELDAESRTHAGALAKNALRHWTSANSAAIRKVLPNGAVSAVLHIYDFRDVEEPEGEPVADT